MGVALIQYRLFTAEDAQFATALRDNSGPNDQCLIARWGRAHACASGGPGRAQTAHVSVGAVLGFVFRNAGGEHGNGKK